MEKAADVLNGIKPDSVRFTQFDSLADGVRLLAELASGIELRELSTMATKAKAVKSADDGTHANRIAELQTLHPVAGLPGPANGWSLISSQLRSSR